MKLKAPRTERLIELAERAENRRSFYPLHNGDADPIQRMYNLLLSGSYIKPHKHDLTETFVLLEGDAMMVFFDDDGNVLHKIRMNGKNKVIDMPRNAWHSLFSVSEHSLFFIIKEGPYVPENKIFAPWAPETWGKFTKLIIKGNTK